MKERNESEKIDQEGLVNDNDIDLEELNIFDWQSITFACPHCGSENTRPASDIEKSFEMECLDCLQRFKPEEFEEKITLARVLYQQAIQDFKAEQPDLVSIKAKLKKALDLLLEAIKTGAKEPGMEDVLAMLYFNLAKTSLAMHQREEAREAIGLYQKCLRTIAQSRKRSFSLINRWLEGIVYNQMSEAYSFLQQEKEALSAQKKAAKNFEAFIKEPDGFYEPQDVEIAYIYLLRNLWYIISALIEDNKDKLAIRYLEKFLFYFEQVPESLELVSQVQNAGLALAYQNLYLLLQRSSQAGERARAQSYGSQAEHYYDLAGGQQGLISLMHLLKPADTEEAEEVEELLEQQDLFEEGLLDQEEKYSTKAQKRKKARKAIKRKKPARFSSPSHSDSEHQVSSQGPSHSPSFLSPNRVGQSLMPAQSESTKSFLIEVLELDKNSSQKDLIKEMKERLQAYEQDPDSDEAVFLFLQLTRELAGALGIDEEDPEVLGLQEIAARAAETYLERHALHKRELVAEENLLALFDFEIGTTLHGGYNDQQKTAFYLDQAARHFKSLKKRDKVLRPEIHAFTLGAKVQLLNEMGLTKEAKKLEGSLLEECGREAVLSLYEQIQEID